MNYKKIFRSRALRTSLLRLLSFVPDKPMVKMQYRIKTGRRLDLKNPRRLTEKMQWYKLYYHNPLMVRCVDKADVRGYVEEKGLGHLLIPLIGVYDSADEVDWEHLPDRFVMKDTLGGGGNSVEIVPDKSKADPQALRRAAERWTKINPRVRGGGREWPYNHGKNHRILFEEYIDPPKNSASLIDYKFFCFGGKAAFVYAMGDRDVGTSVKVSLFDRDFNKLPVRRVGDADFDGVRKPENYAELLATAEKLSEDFPHVRVDLYDVDGRILFGELTFFNASGYMQYDPDSFDLEMGEKFVLPDRMG